MKDVAFARVARVLVENCGHVCKDDQVLILTDQEYPQSIVESIYNAACAVGAETVMLTMSPRESNGLFMTGNVPKTVGPSILASNVLFACTTKVFSGEYADFRDQMLKNGGRALQLPLVTEDLFLRTILIDYDQLASRVSSMVKLLSETETARLVSSNGTDISFSLKGRRVAMNEDGVIRQGEAKYYPAGYVGIAIQEGSANGTVVFDGTLSYTYDPIMETIGNVLEPIVCKVKNGKVFEIAGGYQAKQLEKRMKAADANASNFGEIGLGFNPRARPNTGGLHEDEKSEGIILVGLGKNNHVLGSVASNFHFDATILHENLVLNGRTIIEDMKFKIK